MIFLPVAFKQLRAHTSPSVLASLKEHLAAIAVIRISVTNGYYRPPRAGRWQRLGGICFQGDDYRVQSPQAAHTPQTPPSMVADQPWHSAQRATTVSAGDAVPLEFENAKHALAAVAQELGSTLTELTGSQARLAWSGQAHFHQQLREGLSSAGILKQSDYGSISEEQFSTSPDLSKALIDAIMDAFEAHQTMSSQALRSAKFREGLRDVLLGPEQLYEALWTRAAE